MKVSASPPTRALALKAMLLAAAITGLASAIPARNAEAEILDSMEMTRTQR